MIRKAYRKYFKDVDESHPNADKYFLIDVLEKGEQISDSLDNPINVQLDTNQGVKAYVYDFNDGWRLEHTLNTGTSKETVTIQNKFVLMYEKFDFSSTTPAIAQEYALTIYPVHKGEKFNNGNSGNTVNQGMFNETGFQNINIGKSTHIGNRNKLGVIGGCKEVQGLKICPSFQAVANNGNDIFIKTKSCFTHINFICGNDNLIIADSLNEDCYFGNNNIIRYPDFSFTDIYLMPQYPNLAFQTIITEAGKAGDNFVTVKDTSFVLHNAKFMFASKDSGFVFKRISNVIGNKIYFDKPVSAQEAPIKNGICCGEVPQEEPEIELQLKRKVMKYSRRLFTNATDDNLHLRKCIISKNGKNVLETIALYFDEPSHTLIINDIMPENLDPDSDDIKITFPEFKFVGPYEFTLGQNTPSLYVGEQVLVDNKPYTVSGYDYSKNTIDFKEIDFKDVENKNATVKKVDESYYNTKIIPFKKLNLLKGKTYLDIIKVSFTEGLIPGAYIKYGNNVIKITDVKIMESEKSIKIKKFINNEEVIVPVKPVELTLERSFTPFVLNNKLIVGRFVSDINFNLEDAKEDLESFKKLEKGNP